jgi:copper oxidase (laccase) domain-containing protein
VAGLTLPSPDPAVRIVVSTRADGDFHLDADPLALAAARARLVGLPWTQPDEVHGTHVLLVDRPGHHDGAVGDVAVTDCAGAVLGIWVGDCAPVALVSAGGRIAGVHAGWRGLAAGVLAVAVAAVRRAPDEPVQAVLGPCIHPCCYEFGATDLAAVERAVGGPAAGTTSTGLLALDVPAAVRAGLAVAGVALDDRSTCTGCHGDRWFSHRRRAERGRQVMAIWREAA